MNMDHRNTPAAKAAGHRAAPQSITDEGTHGGGRSLTTVPGTRGVMWDRDGARLVSFTDSGVSRTFLDWAPLLLAWWRSQDGTTTFYRVQVTGQIDDVTAEHLRDGSAWELFDYAAGHDTRVVREALASCVKMQRRDLPEAPGLSSLGWHEVDGSQVYVSTGFCFGPDGEVEPNVHVYNADEAELPAEPDAERTRKVVRTSLSVLDAAVPHVSAPAMCSVWLAPLVSLFGANMPRFTPWMWSDGRAQDYGVFKSSLAVVLQAHSGIGYRSENDLIPANDTTSASLADLLAVRRDTLAILDDYKPGETSAVRNRMQTLIEEALRMASNRQRRRRKQRGRPEVTSAPGCGGLLMVVGECLPLFDSGSTHDRTFAFRVRRGDVDAAALTVLQGAMDDYPQAGAAYVAWLARNADQVRAMLADRFPKLRAELSGRGVFAGRSATHAAFLWCAGEVFTRFAVECGAMAAKDRAPRLLWMGDALTAAHGQIAVERQEDQPDQVWIEGLRAAFASGDLYALAVDGKKPDGQPEENADALGWREGHPMGRTVGGYAFPDGLGVLESKANEAIGRVARNAGKSLAVTGASLRRLLAGQGVITAYEQADRHEHMTSRRIGGSRKWLVMVPWPVFLGEDPQQEAAQQESVQQEAPAAPAVIPAQETVCTGCGEIMTPQQLAGHGVCPLPPAPEPDLLPCVLCGKPCSVRGDDGRPMHLGGLCALGGGAEPAPAPPQEPAPERTPEAPRRARSTAQGDGRARSASAVHLYEAGALARVDGAGNVTPVALDGAADLDALLRAVAGRGDGAAPQLLIAPDMLAELGMPAEHPRKEVCEAITALRGKGWAGLGKSGEFSPEPWIVIGHQQYGTVHLCVLPWIDSVLGGDGDPQVRKAARLARVHDLIGRPWGPTPGRSAADLHRALAEAGRGLRPRWQVKDADLPKDLAGPDGLRRGLVTWRSEAEPDEGLHLHKYDANLNYLASYSEPLAFDALTHTGACAFDPAMQGAWLVTVPEWDDPAVPAPWGLLNDVEPGDRVWVTRAVMVLARERGVRLEVADSWTAKGRKIAGTAEFTALVRDAIETERAGANDRHVVDVLKSLYRALHGFWGAVDGKGIPHRLDWYAAVRQDAMCRILRKVYTVQELTGRTPVKIDVDAITYASAEADRERACPPLNGKTRPALGAGLGQFH